MNFTHKTFDAVIVGGGFTGLTAALELSRLGKSVIVIEADNVLGGLSGTFEFNDGFSIEKYYHYWFSNDEFVPVLAKKLGVENDIFTMPSKMGMYFAGKHWRFTTPMDLLRFKPLPFLDRIRLGLLVIFARSVKNWKTIEHLTAREWLEPLCGKNAFRVVWKPLIDNKFSIYSDAVNAVWIWKKLNLRGGSRDSKGGEQLAYFKGGFGRLVQRMSEEIVARGGEIRCSSAVTRVTVEGGAISALATKDYIVSGQQYLFTTAFPIIADIFKDTADDEWISRLRRVKYLGNICLVLQLDRSLSDTFWLNVNDPDFPFVGVIEHTNLDTTDSYNGKHIVYLSRYQAREDPLWDYTDEAYIDFVLVNLKRMFPHFDRSWIVDFKIWRAEYAQPVTECNYSDYVPGRDTPYRNAWISTMAHIYPEDRGTNYAIREGLEIAALIANQPSVR